MARRYAEPIEVSRRDDQPAEFVRAHRHYRIRSVLAHWVETPPWWLALELSDQAFEQEVWRVEASIGPGTTGVYDVRFDWSSGRWSLTRVLD